MSEQPSDLFNVSQDWLDDRFRWKVAAAVVEEAQSRGGPTGAYVVWNWVVVGEVFSRHLHIALKLPIDANDEKIRGCVQNSWDYLAAGMPAKE